MHMADSATRFLMHMYILGTLRKSAFNLWVAYRKSRDRPTEINADELVEAEEIISDLCRFTSSQMIPINFDENLECLANSTTNRLVTSTTLEKYIGKIIKYFRAVDHIMGNIPPCTNSSPWPFSSLSFTRLNLRVRDDSVLVVEESERQCTTGSAVFHSATAETNKTAEDSSNSTVA